MNHPSEIRHTIPSAPIHPLAALVTVVLDNVIGVFEMVSPVVIVLTGVIVFTLGSVTTLLIQRYLAGDDWGAAIAKGLAMGILAGVPFSVTGTIFGVPLLAWAGLHEWSAGRDLPRPGNEQSETDPTVVEGEFHDEKPTGS